MNLRQRSFPDPREFQYARGTGRTSAMTREERSWVLKRWRRIIMANKNRLKIIMLQKSSAEVMELLRAALHLIDPRKDNNLSFETLLIVPAATGLSAVIFHFLADPSHMSTFCSCFLRWHRINLLHHHHHYWPVIVTISKFNYYYFGIIPFTPLIPSVHPSNWKP